jgi:aspartyl-tRNA(Asn)/glutamyl-tRNA(Gln) amidotransferase subunit A
MVFASLKIRELKKAYQTNSLTPQEVRKDYAHKAARLDEQYGLFITLLKGRESDREFIPAAAADNLCLEGDRTTCASSLLTGYNSPFSAYALEKAMAAGFGILGKTNLDEFGIGVGKGASPFKTTHNPWKAGYYAGSGAAAALAAGAVMTAFASDARGELRQSASYAGVVGMKPTYGRVSRRGLVDYASSLDQVGVITRCVEDAAFALSAISGHDLKDPTSLNKPVDFYPLPKASTPTKLACPREWRSAEGLEASVVKSFEETLRKLAKAGVEIQEVSVPALKQSSLVAMIIAAVEAFSNLANFDGIRFGERTPGEHLQDMYIKTRTAGFGQRVKEMLTLGALVSSGKNYQDHFLWAQKYRRVIKEQLEAVLEETPFLILPTLPFAPPALSRQEPGLEYRGDTYTSLANLAGLPAISLPAGIHEGLPIGLQLVGRPFEEGALLNAAANVETIISFPGFNPEGEEGK